jgi:hypothetical protein
MGWSTLYPSNALASEWDILSVILVHIPQLPVHPSVQHVKGHQDEGAPVATLSLPAQLNCEADALATAALILIAAPIPQSLVFPSAVCQLDVSDATVSRKVQAALRYSAMAPAMSKYLKDRNDWDEATYASVCWPAFSSARYSTPNSRFVPKYSHRHLPVGGKANRNDPKYSPCCPACSSPLETNEQFLLCKAPSRIQWRQQFLASLERELSRLYTSPTMIIIRGQTARWENHLVYGHLPSYCNEPKSDWVDVHIPRLLEPRVARCSHRPRALGSVTGSARRPKKPGINTRIAGSTRCPVL